MNEKEEDVNKYIRLLTAGFLNPLVVPVRLVETTGSVAAALALTTLLKWFAEPENEPVVVDHNGFLWVAPTEKDWISDACLGGSELTNALTSLKNQDLVLSQVFSVDGKEKTRFFRVVFPAVEKLATQNINLLEASTKPVKKSKSSTSTANESLTLADLGINPHPDDLPRYEDCLRVAKMFTELIVHNGVKPSPKITKAWVDDLEKMVRIDGHSIESVEKSIMWAQSNSFWWVNVRSPHKLREKFEMLKKQASDNPQEARQLIQRSRDILDGKIRSGSSESFAESTAVESSEEETRRMAESLGMIWDENQGRWVQPRPQRPERDT